MARWPRTVVHGSRNVNRSPIDITFYLAEKFSMIAFATAIEPLRLANRQSAKTAYRWRVISRDGTPALASNGLTIEAAGGIADEVRRIQAGEGPDYLLVCSGIDAEDANCRTLREMLRLAERRKIRIGGLCTGAWLLARAGLLDGRECAIHWEALPSFQETFPDVDVHADLFEVDDGIYTCAGGTAALDMMLSIIGADHDESLVNAICEQCLTDRVRSPHDRQRLPLRARIGVHNSKLLSAIELMEGNISDPLPMERIAAATGLSRRQIERLFTQNLGRSPARYYLEVRLERARHLLIQTSMPVIEVAIACGFVSASHFSRCYRDLYGRSPQAERQQRHQLVVPVPEEPSEPDPPQATVG